MMNLGRGVKDTFGLRRVVSTLGAKYYDLPARETSTVRITQDLEVPMSDGVTLRADRYYPAGEEQPPLILIRSPYGKSGAWSIFARWFAERGYQVLLQSCRGTSNSGGRFDPLVNEASDGLDTIEWLRDQPWFGDSLATWGPSYLGYVQWALVSEEIPELETMLIQVAPSEFHDYFMYPGDGFAVGNALGFLQVIHIRILQDYWMLRKFFKQLTVDKIRKEAASSIPLRDADQAIVGEQMEFFQQWIKCEDAEGYWDALDHRPNAPKVPSIQLVAGWHDFFLPAMLADYGALREAGQEVQLVIAPTGHGAGQTRYTFNKQFKWLNYKLKDREPDSNPAVHAYLMGADEWLDFDEWPPVRCSPNAWFLHPGGTLKEDSPPSSPPDSYQYDPADPTPNIGGPIVSLRAGPKNQHRKEAREDVLTYTSTELSDPLDVIGQVSATIYVSSTREHSDFYICLCDVDGSGTSMNVCDGLQRLTPNQLAGAPDSPTEIDIELRPTAYRFKTGHRIRIQVASGAFPRWSRNPGVDGCIADSTELVAADQQVYHDPEHPSAIHLPTPELNGTEQ